MTSPLTAASYQWFGIAKNMCEMELAPFIGGIVISTKTWKRIPPDLKPKLLKVTAEVGKEMLKKTSKAEKEAVAIMKKYGLKTHPVSEKIIKQWQEIANKGYEKLMGKSIHEESYKKVKAYIAEYRNK